MGRYSSDSDDSRSSRHKRSKRSPKRSSKVRSRSRSPKRCKKKLKKYKRKNRSHSRDSKNRHSSDRKSRYRHRSRSGSTSDRRRSSKDSERDRRYKDDYKKSKSRRKRRSTSDSSSSSTSSYSSKSKSPTPKRKFEYDPDELLEKLNKAAVEAMAVNKKVKQDALSTIEMQIKRQDTINELRGNSSSSLSDIHVTGPSVSNPMPFSSLHSLANPSEKIPDDVPVVVDLSAPGLPSTPSQPTSNESLLHPNFLLENQEEKLNRWVKKLYQIRQRAMNGELLTV